MTKSELPLPHEPRSEPERIKIGQAFTIFPVDRIHTDTSIAEGYEHLPSYAFEANLSIDGVAPELGFTFSAGGGYKNSRQAFTPFTPELGYQVTSEDFDATLRHQKDFELRERGLGRDVPGTPFLFGAYAQLPPLDKLTPEELLIISSLRFQLYFPNGLAFEARASSEGVYDINFAEGYYPIDTGPLASPRWSLLMHNGLQIALPENPKVISLIQGCFYIAPDLI